MADSETSVAPPDGKLPTAGMFPLNDSTEGCQQWIAVVAAVLSVIFVLLVAQFMAFIEYQGRLARFQPNIPSREVLYEATTRDSLDSELVLLTSTRGKLAESSARMVAERMEVDHRIERVCSQFGSEQPVKNDATPSVVVSAKERCQRFLINVPFDGTLEEAKSTAPAQTRRGPSDAAAVSPQSPEFSEAVLRRFLKHMRAGSSDKNSCDDQDAAHEKDYNDNLYSKFDIVEIAKKNHFFYTNLYSSLENIRSKYRDLCTRAATYASSLKDPLAGEISCQIDVIGPDTVPPATSRAAPVQTIASIATTTQPAAVKQETLTGIVGHPNDRGSNPAQMDAQRRFDLVNQFRYYNTVSLGLAQHLLLSSPDYLATWLLVFGGAMGAMLKILFWHILPARELKWSDLFVEPARGVVCAVILFILFRSGLVIISGGGQSLDSSTLSPFFVAFVAIGAGLMSEQVIYAARRAAGSLIGTAAFQAPPRWAVGLQAALEGAGAVMSLDQLATRLNRKPQQVAAWAAGTVPLNGVMQEKIALTLGIPPHKLFTDINPRAADASQPADPGAAV